MNKGKITAIHGVVVEMSFDKVPGIYEAVEVANKNASGDKVVVEVLQQLWNNKVRWIAMDSTDWLKKWDEVIATGAPITVPVWPEVLWHIFNVLGDTIDETGELKAKNKWHYTK